MRTRRVRTRINHFCTTQKRLCAHSTERQESTSTVPYSILYHEFRMCTYRSRANNGMNSSPCRARRQQH